MNAEPRVWSQLPPELAERIVSFMDRNEVATNFRLFNKAAAAQFRGPQYTTIRLSQPVPPHTFAAKWGALFGGSTRGLTLKRRQQLVCLVAASGVVPNLEVAQRASRTVQRYETFVAAAAAGQLESCKWLRIRNFPISAIDLDSSGLLGAAARGGHQHVCAWLLRAHPRIGPWASRGEAEAARGGHVRLMDWLLARRRPVDPAEGSAYRRGRRDGALPAAPVASLTGPEAAELITAAAHGCGLPTLQRLWTAYARHLRHDVDGQAAALAGLGVLAHQRGDKEEVLAAAAGSPTPDWAAKMEWLEAQGCPRGRGAVAEAAAGSGPDAAARLAWLLGRGGYGVDHRAVVAAARGGNVEALQLLLGLVLPPRPPALLQPRDSIIWAASDQAAQGGHLEALRLLHGAGWLPEVRVCYQTAAREGHLHILAWMVQALGVALDADLFKAGAASGSVEVMAWLAERGCAWDQLAWNAAAEAGCEEALEWLAERGCPMPDNGYPYRVAAIQHDDLNTMKVLSRLGVPWGNLPREFPRMVDTEPMDVLLNMLDAECPVALPDLRHAERRAQARLRRGDNSCMELLTAIAMAMPEGEEEEEEEEEEQQEEWEEGDGGEGEEWEDGEEEEGEEGEEGDEGEGDEAGEEGDGWENARGAAEIIVEEEIDGQEGL
ncbi:hypothetical protein GPECTOR_11g305 [Gonium pectorale]|uniref:Uncharacterized protein n=1 Tax=Gonium pectorale TaxID=33097 RepID=A0A150GPW0_GONPE|nr:hypothetical protein GPECTOR_11g305 [Gonium pectorale]|eukprot:KXZ51869.1 hypothetical protein GPECTOR_11g305 [Gonium pectorale]